MTSRPTRPPAIAAGAAALALAAAAAAAPLELPEPATSGPRLRGRVVDADGRAVPGIEVRVESTAWQGIRAPDVVEHATTDASGAFAFELPRTGRYAIVALAGSLAAAAEQIVRPDDERVLELVLRADPILDVRVMDFDGQPIANAHVRVVYDGSPPHHDRPATELASTDDAGRALIPILARAWSIDVDHEDQVAVHAPRGEATEDSGVQRVDIVLDVAGTLAGRVLDAIGEPVYLASVDALPLASVALPDVRPMARALADRDGRFRFTGLGLHAQYRLVAQDPGFTQLAQVDGVHPSGSEVLMRMEARTGREIVDMLVTDEDTARPIPDFVLRWIEGDGTWGEHHASGGHARLDIELADLPGTVVFAEADGYVTDLEAVHRRDVFAPERDPIALRLARGTPVTVCVGGVDGLPEARALVHAYARLWGGRRLFPSGAAVTDAEGRAEILVREGPTEIFATTTGGDLWSPVTSVDVHPEMPPHVELALSRWDGEASLKVRVMQRDADRADRTEVRVSRADHSLLRPGTSEHVQRVASSGTLVFTGLEPGIWKVSLVLEERLVEIGREDLTVVTFADPTDERDRWRDDRPDLIGVPSSEERDEGR